MRYFRIASVLMTCVPLLFGVSLYTYYFWSKHVVETPSPVAFYQGLRWVNDLTHWLFPLAILSTAINLLFVCILVTMRAIPEHRVWRFMTFYAIGTLTMVTILFVDPGGGLVWWLD